MERELFRQVYQRAYELGRSRRTKHVVYPDWKIVVVYFWAVLHDRPICWACDPRHWPERARRVLPRLPDPSTMCRRLRRQGVLDLVDAIEASMKPTSRTTSQILFIDAKPLPVGWYSKDTEALNGWSGHGIGKGYKLHAICDEHMMPLAWTVRPMNEREPRVAPQLITMLKGTGTLVGDNAYDSNHLYDLAAQRDYQLVAPRRQGTSLGKKRHSPHRVWVHRHLPARDRAELINRRKCIERMFGRLGNLAFGMSPLPNWVRRLRRVRLWVQAKIILYLSSQRLRTNTAS